jgi:hypothetical protein
MDKVQVLLVYRSAKIDRERFTVFKLFQFIQFAGEFLIDHKTHGAFFIEFGYEDHRIFKDGIV